MKLKVLVFPSGTEIAFEIHDALKKSKFVELYGCTSVPNHSDFVFRRNFCGAPYADDPALVDYLNGIIDECGIDYVYPAHDSALMALALRRNELHAKLASSPMETVRICRSKAATYDFLAGEGFLPRVFKSVAEVPSYPVFVKPAIGQASIGARRVDSASELELALSTSQEELVVCEYLPGEEYTVDCFTDRHGRLRAAWLRNRERTRSGISVRSRSIIDGQERARAIGERLNSLLEFRGAWFFQLKRNAEGEFRLMEVSARIPGTMALSRNRGANFPLLTLFDMEGYDVGTIDNGYEALLDRNFMARFQLGIEYRTVYVDYDDTLVLGGYVNAQLMGFLYQAIDKGKKVVLLTRHEGDLNADMESHRIAASLFDDVVWLGKDESKADRIEDGESIFIDDSYAERAEVRDSLGIPVFDVDMVESLIDWRF